MKQHPAYKQLALFLFLLITLFSACSDSRFDETQIIGDWEVATWDIISSGNTRSNKMDMHFSVDRKYEINYGSEIEKGKYWISGEDLFTVGDGESEKKVKLLTLNSDTLGIQMNRGGELENVYLIRPKS